MDAKGILQQVKMLEARNEARNILQCLSAKDDLMLELTTNGFRIFHPATEFEVLFQEDGGQIVIRISNPWMSNITHVGSFWQDVLRRIYDETLDTLLAS